MAQSKQDVLGSSPRVGANTTGRAPHGEGSRLLTYRCESTYRVQLPGDSPITEEHSMGAPMRNADSRCERPILSKLLHLKQQGHSVTSHR